MNNFYFNEFEQLKRWFDLDDDDRETIASLEMDDYEVGMDVATIFLKIGGQILPFSTGSDGLAYIYVVSVADFHKLEETRVSSCLRDLRLTFMLKDDPNYPPFTRATAGGEIEYAPYDCDDKWNKIPVAKFGERWVNIYGIMAGDYDMDAIVLVVY